MAPYHRWHTSQNQIQNRVNKKIFILGNIQLLAIPVTADSLNLGITNNFPPLPSNTLPKIYIQHLAIHVTAEGLNLAQPHSISLLRFPLLPHNS